MRMRSRLACFSILALAVLTIGTSLSASVPIRIGGYGIRLEPEGDDAENFSKASWGGGLYAVVVPPNTANFLSVVAGLDFINMLSQTVEFRDQTTMLRIEQQTNQWLSRFYIGGRVGHQGHGFLRPYAGANIALNYYTISTDVVIPDDRDYENEIRQHLDKESELAFGFDLAIGVELKIKRFCIDLGARYLKTFSVPQQLGPDAEKIHPQYILIYAGFNIEIP